MGFFYVYLIHRKEEINMIKGLAITPPILGRISIGKVVEKNGKRLPEKDDQFTLTSQIQNKDGWVKHPLDEQLRAKAPNQKSTTQSYRTPVYYVDLTLREDIHLQEAIQTAKEIDQKSKLCGFNQAALDQTALQGFANTMFEVNVEEGLEIIEEFYVGDAPPKNFKNEHDLGQVQDFQQELQQSVREFS